MVIKRQNNSIFATKLLLTCKNQHLFLQKKGKGYWQNVRCVCSKGNSGLVKNSTCGNFAPETSKRPYTWLCCFQTLKLFEHKT